MTILQGIVDPPYKGVEVIVANNNFNFAEFHVLNSVVNPGEIVYASIIDGDYVYTGGDSAAIKKYHVEDMTTVIAQSTENYGAVQGLILLGDYIYRLGSGWHVDESVIMKYNKSDLSFVQRGPLTGLGDTVYHGTTDGTYLYIIETTSAGAHTIQKLDPSDLSVVGSGSPSLGGNGNFISVDPVNNHAYVATLASSNNVRKYSTVDFTLSNSATVGTDRCRQASYSDGYVYTASADGYVKFLASNLSKVDEFQPRHGVTTFCINSNYLYHTSGAGTYSRPRYYKISQDTLAVTENALFFVNQSIRDYSGFATDKYVTMYRTNSLMRFNADLQQFSTLTDENGEYSIDVGIEEDLVVFFSYKDSVGDIYLSDLYYPFFPEAWSNRPTINISPTLTLQGYTALNEVDFELQLMEFITEGSFMASGFGIAKSMGINFLEPPTLSGQQVGENINLNWSYV